MEYSIDQYYLDAAASASELPPGLDGAPRTIFEDLGGDEGMSLEEPLAPAAGLIRRLEPELMANVFRWTGHFPERTRTLPACLEARSVPERSEKVPRCARDDGGYRRFFSIRSDARFTIRSMSRG